MFHVIVFNVFFWFRTVCTWITSCISEPSTPVLQNFGLVQILGSIISSVAWSCVCVRSWVAAGIFDKVTPVWNVKQNGLWNCEVWNVDDRLSKEACSLRWQYSNYYRKEEYINYVHILWIFIINLMVSSYHIISYHHIIWFFGADSQSHNLSPCCMEWWKGTKAQITMNMAPKQQYRWRAAGSCNLCRI